jgi:hypothetical protein
VRKIFLLNSRNLPFQMSKFSFSNGQNLQWSPNYMSPRKFIMSGKLSKFSFPNYRNFPFQTVRISFSKLSRFSFSKNMCRIFFLD